jgi:hypothetical protein
MSLSVGNGKRGFDFLVFSYIFQISNSSLYSILCALNIRAWCGNSLEAWKIELECFYSIY